MNGDLIFVDFNRDEDGEKPIEASESKAPKIESKADKIKRLAAQIESGEYEVQTDELTENLLKELSDNLDFE